MAMNRDKFRNIVGGITSPEIPAQPLPPEQPADAALAGTVEMPEQHKPEPEGQGVEGSDSVGSADHRGSGEQRRFAKRGRPKGSKPAAQTGAGRKVKVSLFLSETIVNDLYEWAHADRLHPGEMFEMALKPFHEREAKRRKGGKA